VARYSEAANLAMRGQGFREKLRTQDLNFQEMSSAQIVSELKAELEYWRPVVKRSGFKTSSGL
jgi:tripartite-type tricarboxylate transporter receptor subunit TctC